MRAYYDSLDDFTGTVADAERRKQQYLEEAKIPQRDLRRWQEQWDYYRRMVVARDAWLRTPGARANTANARALRSFFGRASNYANGAENARRIWEYTAGLYR